MLGRFPSSAGPGGNRFSLGSAPGHPVQLQKGLNSLFLLISSSRRKRRALKGTLASKPDSAAASVSGDLSDASWPLVDSSSLPLSFTSFGFPKSALYGSRKRPKRRHLFSPPPPLCAASIQHAVLTRELVSASSFSFPMGFARKEPQSPTAKVTEMGWNVDDSWFMGLVRVLLLGAVGWSSVNGHQGVGASMEAYEWWGDGGSGCCSGMRNDVRRTMEVKDWARDDGKRVGLILDMELLEVEWIRMSLKLEICWRHDKHQLSDTAGVTS
ncbi:hypothetical protein GQ457_15G017590 [Hibiscus cannabinus]